MNLLRATSTLPLLLLGCYQPDFSQTYLRCDVENANRCPDGLSCVDGYCGPPFPSRNGAPSPRVDAASPVDMGPWTGVTLSEQPACSISAPGGSGYLLRPKLVACVGFGQSIRGTCKAPWTPCSASILTREECQALPWGFFSSGVTGLQPSPPPAADDSCNAWGNPTVNVRTLFGCGTSKATPTFDVNGACRNFHRLVPVASRSGQPATWWTSPTTSDFGYAQPSDPGDGVLCCVP